MNSKVSKRLWLFAAVCFIFAGIAGKNTVFIVLGCAYICISLSINIKKTKDKDDEKE